MWHEQVVCRLKPRNRWVMAQVPRTWSDVDYIFERVLFAGLIFFWEQDWGEDTLRHQWESLERKHADTLLDWEKDRIATYKKVYSDLKAAYEWAKIRDSKFNEFNTWEEEDKYHKIDDLHLTNIIKNRKFMWT